VIPAVGFVGSSGSGKTTLIERILPVLRSGGYRVGVVKHAHKGFQMDRPGKDSYRVREAGAVQVLVASHRHWALIGEEAPGRPEPSLGRLLGRFSPGEVDLVLAEGFSHERFPKIEVFRPSHGQPPHCWPHDADVVAVASDAPIELPPPLVALDLNRPEQVAEFVLSRVPGVPARRGRSGSTPRAGRPVPPE
jgi:molybdopterin-guanine dinucleotide biosynthesis protein B